MDGMSYAAFHGLGKISDPEVDLIDGVCLVFLGLN